MSYVMILCSSRDCMCKNSTTVSNRESKRLRQNSLDTHLLSVCNSRRSNSSSLSVQIAVISTHTLVLFINMITGLLKRNVRVPGCVRMCLVPSTQKIIEVITPKNWRGQIVHQTLEGEVRGSIEVTENSLRSCSLTILPRLYD